jgi:FkbM family methyltransferase
MTGIGTWLRGLGRPQGKPLRAHTRYAYLGDHKGLAVLNDGSRIYVDTRDVSLTPSLILYGCWEPWIERALIGLVRPGAIAVDLGANFGYYTIALAWAVGPRGKVYAFEANPQLAGLLSATVATNGLRDRVVLANAAIIDREEVVKLHVDPQFVGGGHLSFGAEEPALEHYSVAGTTLCVALAGIERIDILRMDIEGSEPLALRGAEALIRNSPELVIVCEWSVPMMAAHCDLGGLIDWLSEMGFSFWEILIDSSLRPVSREGLLTLNHCDVAIARDDPRRRLHPPAQKR